MLIPPGAPTRRCFDFSDLMISSSEREENCYWARACYSLNRQSGAFGLASAPRPARWRHHSCPRRSHWLIPKNELVAQAGVRACSPRAAPATQKSNPLPYSSKVKTFLFFREKQKEPTLKMASAHAKRRWLRARVERQRWTFMAIARDIH